jgi:hypothetical protein
MTTRSAQDELRIAVGRTRSLAEVAVKEFDDVSWSNADSEQVERIAYLLEAVESAASTAVAAVDRFEIVVADQSPVEPGDDRW